MKANVFHDVAGRVPLKLLRARQGLSLQNLADLLGSSAATLMRIEHGGMPRGELVLRLQRWAAELGEEIAWPRRQLRAQAQTPSRKKSLTRRRAAG